MRMRKILSRISRGDHDRFTSHRGDGTDDTKKLILQGFEWYHSSAGDYLRNLPSLFPSLKGLGVSDIWLPPLCKASGLKSNGYDVYDLFDLGEFDQKGSVRTKWGAKDDLTALSLAAQQAEIGLLFDAVLNHKSAADYVETCQAVKVDKEEIGVSHQIHVWTGYNFEGRHGKYSSFKWHWRHFTGTDWEANLKTNDNLYRFEGPDKQGWAKDVDHTQGNADFLMGNDIDHAQPEVAAEMEYWGCWVTEVLSLSGFRLDAVKHFSRRFLKGWIEKLDTQFKNRNLFFVGEYWREDVSVLGSYIEYFNGRMHLFDVILAGNFSSLSRARPDSPEGDLRKVLNGTLARHYPDQAVTFVQNHDTQPRFESDHVVEPMEQWFVPLAYAFILLRPNSGIPCLFWGDLYGTSGTQPSLPKHKKSIEMMCRVRNELAFGDHIDYLDERNCIGFTLSGLLSRNGRSGCAIVISNDSRSRRKKMLVGAHHKHETWHDILGNVSSSVKISAQGYGEFSVASRSVSIWVDVDAFTQAKGERLLV